MVAIANQFVEMAVDRQGDTEYLSRHSAMLELQRKAIESAVPGKSDEFYGAVMLGIETARVYLEGNPPAVFAKVSI
jgi:hypothetical protein